MKLFRRPQFKGVTRALLVLLMVTLAGRSEANCFLMTPEPIVQSQVMADCADMDSDAVNSQHPSPLHHSDKEQAGMCHLGCPVLLTFAEAKNGYAGLLSPTYVPESAPVLAGISDIPQTPPPRFG